MKPTHHRCYACNKEMTKFVRYVFIDKSHVTYENWESCRNRNGDAVFVPVLSSKQETRRTYTFDYFCLSMECRRSHKQADLAPEWKVYIKQIRISPKKAIIYNVDEKKGRKIN